MHLHDLKELVFQILLDITQPDDEEKITAFQSSNIGVSAAVAKNGVNIINNQTQTFIVKKTMPKIIEMLKMIDALEASRATLPIRNIEHKKPEQIENKKLIDITPKVNSDPIEACCAHLFKSRMELKNVQSLMRKKYVEYVYNQFDSAAEAAEAINSSYQNFRSIIDLKGKREKIRKGLK